MLQFKELIYILIKLKEEFVKHFYKALFIKHLKINKTKDFVI